MQRSSSVFTKMNEGSLGPVLLLQPPTVSDEKCANVGETQMAEKAKVKPGTSQFTVREETQCLFGFCLFV